MCLAQGPQRSDAGEARTAAPRSRVKHSTTELLRSQSLIVLICMGKNIRIQSANMYLSFTRERD